MADDVRWLDQTEMTAWRAFLKVSTRLFDQLDRELVESHGLSLDNRSTPPRRDRGRLDR